MIHKNERARLHRHRRGDSGLAVRGREKFRIGAIKDNRQLFGWHSSFEQQLLKGPANGHDVVRKRGRYLLLPGCQAHYQLAQAALCLHPHQFRADILHIQNDLCSQQFRYERGKDEKIRHVMHVNHIVGVLQMESRDDNGGQYEKPAPAQDRYGQGASKPSLHRHTIDTHSIAYLVPLFVLLLYADDIDLAPSINGCFGHAPYSRVERIPVKSDHTNTYGRHITALLSASNQFRAYCDLCESTRLCTFCFCCEPGTPTTSR